MNDSRIKSSFPGHPKTKKLIRRAGVAGAWHFLCLIVWARDNRPDGDLSGMSSEDIELAANWTGDIDLLVGSLVEVGYLEGHEGAYQIHDWADHQPWATGSELRSDKGRWAALIKQHGREEAARIMPDYAKRLLESASSTQKSATSTDKESPVPVSVSVSVSKALPHTPNGDGISVPVAKPKRKPKDTLTFAAFVAACKTAGEKAVPDDDAIFTFADTVSIPREFLRLAWIEFRNQHKDSGKGQKDWRAHFRNAVRRNWFKLWWFPKEGECELTTAGVQLKREHEANQQAQAQQQEAQA